MTSTSSPSTSSMQRMPALFIGHGSPMNALEDNRYTQAWRAASAALPHKPKAVLCVSAHWLTRGGTVITAMDKPRTIHDFGGFPRPLFEVQYPAPGSRVVAERVQALLAPHTKVALDDGQWGLDHGAWSILIHLYPDADVPVLQLSIDSNMSNAQHYKLAQALAPLRDEGVLILGSGNVVHHLGRIQWSKDAPAHDWATRFDAQVKTAIETKDHATLMKGDALNADAKQSIPTPEHYWPLMYVIAQQQAGDSVQQFAEGIDLGSISMRSLRVG